MYIDKQKLIEWLHEKRMDETVPSSDQLVYWQVMYVIESGAFDIDLPGASEQSGVDAFEANDRMIVDAARSADILAKEEAKDD